MRPSGKRRCRSRGGQKSKLSRAKRGEARANLYDAVTQRIAGELEAGARVPWVQPGTAAPGLPCNALAARNYSGVNVPILWRAVIESRWPSQSWLTFRQAREAGA